MYSRVYVEITNVCNKNCSFCHKTSRKKRSMTLGEFSLICDKLVGITKYIYLHVMGEPLTHPLLSEFISHASAKGFKVAVTTNGSLLPLVGEKLIGSDIYKVSISLHSFESGEISDHEKYINSCLDFADRASDNGILTILRLWNSGVNDTMNDSTLALMKKRFQGTWVYGTRGARIKDKLHLEYGERFGWPDVSGDDLGSELFCHGLGDHFGILVGGEIIPCCLDSDGAVTLGNIYTDAPLDAVLNSDRANAIREGFQSKKAVEELCKRCPYARRFKI